jgi:demethylmenaquinone methyltransferase/2-methoxy-6-polyprenyl-1,4-benzoquinol methylase
MFEAAGYEEYEHHIQQASPQSPRAITTVARVSGGDKAGDNSVTGAEESASTAPDAE